mmetsp:Transcript_13751/g.42574  ORF Transcript_13751/g.42574 Transcript_13751/m.42574 type:complete len:327 (+) Transcript_13751:3-983(+)
MRQPYLPPCLFLMTWHHWLLCPLCLPCLRWGHSLHLAAEKSLLESPTADQSALQVYAATGTETAPVSLAGGRARRELSRKLARFLVTKVVAQAHNISHFLFDDESALGLFGGDEAAVFCSREDKEKMRCALNDLLQGLDISQGATEMNTSKPFSNASLPSDVNIVSRIPPACKAMASQGDLVACLWKLTGASRDCVRCIPRFFHQVKDMCRPNCKRTIDQLANQLVPITATMVDRSIQKPAWSSTAKRAEKDLQHEVSSVLKGLVPCMFCVQQRLEKLIACAGDADTQTFANMVMQDIIMELQRGGMPTMVMPETIVNRLSTNESS